MILGSKYEFSQELFSIQRCSVERPPVPCHACEDGFVALAGGRYQCPACKGRRTIQARAHGWIITGRGRVGKIDIEYIAPYHDRSWGDGEVKGGEPFMFVTYMLSSTGIGSGTVYEEPNLLPSREEAQAECDRRNGWAVSP